MESLWQSNLDGEKVPQVKSFFRPLVNYYPLKAQQAWFTHINMNIMCNILINVIIVIFANYIRHHRHNEILQITRLWRVAIMASSDVRLLGGSSEVACSDVQRVTESGSRLDDDDDNDDD